MDDFEKVLVQEGLSLAPKDHFSERKYIDDPYRWASFVYVYDTVYSKNDRLLWAIPESSDNCTVQIYKDGDFLYLYYKNEEGKLEPIVFTHVKNVPEQTAFDALNAWWN